MSIAQLALCVIALFASYLIGLRYGRESEISRRIDSWVKLEHLIMSTLEVIEKLETEHGHKEVGEMLTEARKEIDSAKSDSACDSSD